MPSYNSAATQLTYRKEMATNLPERAEKHRLLSYLSVSEFVAIAVGFLYFTGYYINSIFIRNLGIVRSELFKLEYIAIGLVFGLATIGFTIAPVGILHFVYQVRRRSGLPHLHIGAIGNSLNTSTFFLFSLFLALFITKFEWDSKLPVSVIGITNFSSIAITSLILSTTGMAIVPFVERLVDKQKQSRAKKWWWILIEVARLGLFVASILLIIGALIQIPWLGSLLVKAFYFLLAGAVFVGGIMGATFWIKKIGDFPTKWLIYCLIGFGIVSLYFMAVTSYVFGVYNFVPYNRGGRLPLTRAFVQISEDKKIPVAPETFIDEIRYQGPFYIIEESEDSLFVASQDMDRWFDEFVPVHVIRKEDINQIRLERITNGFPRTKE